MFHGWTFSVRHSVSERCAPIFFLKLPSAPDSLQTTITVIVKGWSYTKEIEANWISQIDHVNEYTRLSHQHVRGVVKQKENAMEGYFVIKIQVVPLEICGLEYSIVTVKWNRYVRICTQSYPTFTDVSWTTGGARDFWFIFRIQFNSVMTTAYMHGLHKQPFVMTDWSIDSVVQI